MDFLNKIDNMLIVLAFDTSISAHADYTRAKVARTQSTIALYTELHANIYQLLAIVVDCRPLVPCMSVVVPSLPGAGNTRLPPSQFISHSLTVTVWDKVSDGSTLFLEIGPTSISLKCNVAEV